jgi:hypothetical protein
MKGAHKFVIGSQILDGSTLPIGAAGGEFD